MRIKICLSLYLIAFVEWKLNENCCLYVTVIVKSCLGFMEFDFVTKKELIANYDLSKEFMAYFNSTYSELAINN